MQSLLPKDTLLRTFLNGAEFSEHQNAQNIGTFVVPWDMKIHVTETMKRCDVDGTSSNGVARTLKKLR